MIRGFPAKETFDGLQHTTININVDSSRCEAFRGMAGVHLVIMCLPDNEVELPAVARLRPPLDSVGSFHLNVSWAGRSAIDIEL